MKIKNWPLDRVMQLPDHCFGRRFVVSCYQFTTQSGVDWDISEIALPEKTIIWEVFGYVPLTQTVLASFRLALGDYLPGTTAQMDALEPLLPGVGAQGAGPRQIPPLASGSSFHLEQLRLPIAAGGRRLVLEVTAGIGGGGMQICAVVSSMPTDLPNYLNDEYWELLQETFRRR